jgi:hypothetical protein
MRLGSKFTSPLHARRLHPKSADLCIGEANLELEGAQLGIPPVARTWAQQSCRGICTKGLIEGTRSGTCLGGRSAPGPVPGVGELLKWCAKTSAFGTVISDRLLSYLPDLRTMKKDPDQKFFVGDKVKFGRIEEGTVRAVIQTTAGPVSNISFGPKGDLAASVNARQVVEKLPPVN